MPRGTAKKIKNNNNNNMVMEKLVKHRKVGREVPGYPVINTSLSSAGGLSSIPGWGTKIPHTSWPKKQNIKQRQYCNKLKNDLKKKKEKKSKEKTKKKASSSTG